jgi:hypothetical protein
MIFRLFTLCSARVGALVIVLSDRPCEVIGKRKTCPILKDDRSFARVYLERLWQELPHYWVYRLWQFLRLCHHIRFIGRQHQWRGAQWAKINSDRKSSSYIEDCFEKSQLLQHRWQQKWIFILKTPSPQKLSDVSFTGPTSALGLQRLNLNYWK